MITLFIQKVVIDQGVPQARQRLNHNCYSISASADVGSHSFDLERAYIGCLTELFQNHQKRFDTTHYHIRPENRSWTSGNSYVFGISEQTAPHFRRPKAIGCLLVAYDYPDGLTGRGPSMLGAHMDTLVHDVSARAPVLIKTEDSCDQEPTSARSDQITKSDRFFLHLKK